MLCPKCNFQNLDQAQFCQNCGNQLVVSQINNASNANRFRKTGLIIIVLLIFIIVCVFLLYKLTNKIQIAQNISLSSPTNTPTINNFINNTNPELSWETYRNEQIGFEIKSPKEFKISQPTDKFAKDVPEVDFYFSGPNETQGTEENDGIQISILKPHPYSTATFKEFVDNQVNDCKKQDKLDCEVLKDESSIVLNGVNGYEYTVVGQGAIRFIYLPLTEKNYIEIHLIVVDPNKRGYQDTVDKMLSTFKLGQVSNIPSDWGKYKFINYEKKNIIFYYPPELKPAEDKQFRGAISIESKNTKWGDFSITIQPPPHATVNPGAEFDPNLLIENITLFCGENKFIYTKVTDKSPSGGIRVDGSDALIIYTKDSEDKSLSTFCSILGTIEETK